MINITKYQSYPYYQQFNERWKEFDVSHQSLFSSNKNQFLYQVVSQEVMWIKSKSVKLGCYSWIVPNMERCQSLWDGLKRNKYHIKFIKKVENLDLSVE